MVAREGVPGRTAGRVGPYPPPQFGIFQSKQRKARIAGEPERIGDMVPALVRHAGERVLAAIDEIAILGGLGDPEHQGSRH